MGIDFSAVPTSTPVAQERLGALNGIPVYRYEPEPECEHIATVTAPLHVTHGQNVYTTDPVTICVTCHAAINFEETP